MAQDDKPAGTPAPEGPKPAAPVPQPPPSSPLTDPLDIVINTPTGGSGGMYSTLDKLIKLR